MTPEDIARMNYEKARKAQIEQKKVINDLKSRLERLEELVSLLLEKAGESPVETAKPEEAETPETEEETDDEIQ